MRRKLSAVLVIAALLAVLAAPAAQASTPVTLPDYQPTEFTSEMRGADYPLDTTGINPGLTSPEGDATSGEGGGVTATVTQVGEQRLWLVLDDYYGKYRFTPFTLRAIGTHGEVWVANALNFPTGDPRNDVVITDDQVNYLLNQFDNVIYPKDTEFFGAPDTHTGENSLLDAWGYDIGYNDGSDRSVILVANVRDESYYDSTYPNYIAGYYSSTIEAYTDKNVITIDAYDWANRVGPDVKRPYLYEGVIAHEYQHLIHDDNDGDEENWINEGQADFAGYLCGYTNLNTDSHISEALDHPYNSLVAWQDQGGRLVLADYGNAFLFQLYLAQHYGGAPFIQALHKNPLNGIESVNDTLAAFGYNVTFEDVYRDFEIAMLINTDTINGDRYKFAGLDKRINFSAPDGTFTGDKALAWGPNLNVIENSPKISNITLDGVQFLGTPWSVVSNPDGDGSVLFGGTGDLADNMLIKPLDLTGVTSATLNFETLYDIEEFWDYGFVQVSTDGGSTWTSLANENTQSVTDPNAHPTVTDNVPGFTGYSGGWVPQSFDLSAYAGQQILLSFRYVTDWGSQGNGALAVPGFYVRNISVPEADFSADGSSIADFYGLDQIRNDYADYMVSFVGFKKAGLPPFKVLNLNLVNFDETMQKDLQKFMRDASVSKVVMIVTYAAPVGQLNPIDYSYTVDFHKDAGPSPKE